MFARSTPEADLITLSSAMFTEVINVQTMLQQLLERPFQVNYRQDNQAVVDIGTSGYSAKLRHAPRDPHLAHVFARLGFHIPAVPYCSVCPLSCFVA
jgi:hypothetical protein